MKTLLQFADRSFLVSPELAQQVQDAIPSDRYVTVTPIRDEPDHHLLGQRPAKSKFEQAQQRHHPLTDQQKLLAQRMTKTAQRK